MDKASALVWYAVVCGYDVPIGIAMVKRVPPQLNAIIPAVQRIAYIRPTMYGTVFDVKSVPQPINIAYTSLKLDLHQDLLYITGKLHHSAFVTSYYETPPGIQFLHCIQNEAKGGESVFVDGIKVGVSPYMCSYLILRLHTCCGRLPLSTLLPYRKLQLHTLSNPRSMDCSIGTLTLHFPINVGGPSCPLMNMVTCMELIILLLF